MKEATRLAIDGTNWNRTWDNVQKPERVAQDGQMALNLWKL